ncbi:lectin [Chitinimonas sp. PSY-7]|uniref:lectin n=1 Tax=Chitinimonas sp. PSY-7 TaxID=3459088 RepID=UPI00403FEA29
MKKILIAGVVSLSLAGCGSTNTRYTNTQDDRNSNGVLIGAAAVATAAAGYYAYKKDRKNKKGGDMVVGDGGRCLDIGGGLREGAALQLWDCHGGENQRFRYEDGQLKTGDFCLDIAGGNYGNGTPVIAYRCTGGQNQQWRFSGQQIYSSLNNRCLDVEGRQTGNGARLVMWDCHNGSNQRFTLR